MDFFQKKNVKTKDPGFLADKEYKCASLQAITTEAVKENNKKRLKELVDEINGHLLDLRAVKDHKDTKDKEKCERLIKQFEECLVRILNTHTYIVTPINGQLQELEKLTNAAIKENNVEELKKLAERIERNIAIVNEIPEVKDARNSRGGYDNILKLVDNYTNLLKKVQSHCVEAEMGPKEESLKSTTKIGLNEVEEKLRQLRQKRLNRLSTFVNEQSKLSEQRSRENSPKSFENVCEETTEKIELNQLKPIRPTAITKPIGSYRRENVQMEEKREEGVKESSKREIAIKSNLTKSFAERQIENARNERDAQLRSSAPKTPTQIRKLLNTINSCVIKPNTQKSIEDLPAEFNSVFEQELKTVQLKSTALPPRTGSFKVAQDEAVKEHLPKKPVMKEVPPPVVPPRKPLEKPLPLTRTFAPRGIEKSASQSEIPLKSKRTAEWRSSVDFDRASHRISDPPNTISIIRNRDSYFLDTPVERCSFSTFRSSTEETQNAIDNPIYDLVQFPLENNNNYSTLSKKKNINNKLAGLESDIDQLQKTIKQFKGLKRDNEYTCLDKSLTKFYVKVNEFPTDTSSEDILKDNLMRKLKEAHDDLKNTVENNEGVLKRIFEEQVELLGKKYGLA